MSPKISIIIPSRDRGFYLEQSIKTATSIEDSNIEIVVSDNNSTDNTKAVIENCKDARVRYFNTGKRVSMRQNFEFALRKATGDYFITFGDDDGILPGQFSIIRSIIEERRPDVLSWDFLTYGWPIGDNSKKSGGCRIKRANCFGQPQKINAQSRLLLLEKAYIDNSKPLPTLYHGCMSRRYLDQLAENKNPYFRSSSPDIYISFRALQHGGDFWHINHPLSINGFSPASTGGSMSRLHASVKKPETPFLIEAKTDEVKDVIPSTKSMAMGFLGTIETIRYLYPEDILSPDYVSWYRQVLLDASKKDPTTAEEIMESLASHAKQFEQKEAMKTAIKLGLPTKRRLKEALSRNLKKIYSFRRSTRIGNHDTIATAAKVCDQILGQSGQKVLEKEISPRQAWIECKKRSNKFAKQI